MATDGADTVVLRPTQQGLKRLTISQCDGDSLLGRGRALVMQATACEWVARGLVAGGDMDGRPISFLSPADDASNRGINVSAGSSATASTP